MSYQTITVSWNGSNIVETPDPAPAPGHVSAPVHAGHHVQWVIGEGVTEITDIALNPSPGIFSELPTAANNWTGLVASGATGEDTYTVFVNTNDGPKTLDPKLKVDQTPDPPKGN